MAIRTLAELFAKGEVGPAADYRRGKDRAAARQQQQFANKLELDKIALEARRIAESERSNRASEKHAGEELSFRKTKQKADSAFDVRKLMSEESRAAAELKFHIQKQNQMYRIYSDQNLNDAERNRLTQEYHEDMIKVRNREADAKMTSAIKKGTSKIPKLLNLSNDDEQQLLREMNRHGLSVNTNEKTGYLRLGDNESARLFYDDVIRTASVLQAEALDLGQPIDKPNIIPKAVAIVQQHAQAEGKWEPSNQVSSAMGWGATSYKTPSALEQVFNNRLVVPERADPLNYNSPIAQAVAHAKRLKEQGMLDATTIQAIETQFQVTLPPEYKSDRVYDPYGLPTLGAPRVTQ